MNRKVRGILFVLTIVMTTLFIGCAEGNAEDLKDFRARIDAYVDVQNITLNDFINNKISEEEFNNNQNKNLKFLEESKNQCPNELLGLYNNYIDSVKSFKVNESKESFDTFKISLDALYMQVTELFNENNLTYDKFLVSKYIGEINR